VSVLLRQPGGGFAAEAGSPVPVGLDPLGVAARDLNGDGRPDLAVANYQSDNVTLLLRQSGGGFAADPASPLAAGDGPSGIAVRDFDGNGLADVAVSNNIADTLTVQLRQGGGGFAPDSGSPITMPDGPGGIASADFNADGWPDLAVTSDQASVLNVLLNANGPQGPGPVVGLPAQDVAVPAGAKKVPRVLEQALASAELEQRLASAPATSQIEQLKSQKQARSDPAVVERMASLAFGVPVEVVGDPGDYMAISVALAIARESQRGAKIAQVSLPVAVVQLTESTTIAQVPVDKKALSELARTAIDEAAVAVVAKKIPQDELDSMAEMGEMESLRLQMAMDRLAQFKNTLTNLLNKLSEVSSSIASNIRRPIPGKRASKKQLLKRARTAANKAAGEQHEAASLLAPGLTAHPADAPRATFGLKPCPKRCKYPRFR
jgi:hypothetical protein